VLSFKQPVCEVHFLTDPKFPGRQSVYQAGHVASGRHRSSALAVQWLSLLRVSAKRLKLTVVS
jgi:hypothetical protein